MSVNRRRAMIEPGHARLSVVRQCALVSLVRPTFYRAPVPKTMENLALMRLLDAQFLETPWHGSRQMPRHLRRQGHAVGCKRVRRLMAVIWLAAIYQRPRTSAPHPAHRIHPYLLRDLVVDRPNQVWCADIMYIPMRRGFLYLVAVMDGATRRVLSWRLSNTMDVEFCLAAPEEVLAWFGRPDVFNTDRGSQFTSPRFIEMLVQAGARISMAG
jgi:putative transposase